MWPIDADEKPRDKQLVQRCGVLVEVADPVDRRECACRDLILKLAAIEHLTLHIYCACRHYADLKVADIIPTMSPEATVADVLLSRKCSKYGTKVPPQVRITYKL